MGAGLAVGVAIAASPLTPIGLARKAEVDQGVAVNLPVLAIGLPVLVAVLLLRIAFSAEQVSAAGPDQRRAPRAGMRTSERLAGLGLPVTAVLGVRLALESGRGRTRVPVRAGLAGGVLGVMAVAGVVVFSTSLGRLLDRPSLQGWRWEAALGNPHGQDLRASGAGLTADPDLDDVTSIGMVETRVGERPVSLTAVDVQAGHLPIPVVEGRAPASPVEVALGGRLLGKLRADVGDEVEIADQPFRVVGRALVSPLIVNDTIGLGGGGILTVDGAARLTDEVVLNQFLVTLRPGAARQPVLERLRAQFPGAVLTAHRPADIVNLSRVRQLPHALAALLGVVALATIGHTLITSVRRRRRDLAILKTLGFVGSQVVRTIIWQAGTLLGAALAVGLPLGIVLGRLGWKVLVGAMALPVDAALPMLWLCLLVPIGLVTATLIAAGPALTAARTRTAAVLSAD